MVLTPARKPWHLRTPDPVIRCTPRVKTNIGSSPFSIAGPTMENSLDHNVKSEELVR